MKTRASLADSKGGVLLIDEAYGLFESTSRDSFKKTLSDAGI